MNVSKKLSRFLYILSSTSLFLGGCQSDNGNTTGHQTLFVSEVSAAFPVNFELLTTGNRQYVAYYDTAHQMVIASRELSEKRWNYKILDSKIEWDSHNYLSLDVDSSGTIHLVGNMHSSPLVYFRSQQPYNIESLHAIHFMTGKEEDVTTYPEFMRGPNNALIFHYRYGVSGSGYEVYNKWNPDTEEWTRLLDTPLTDGQGKMNAYMQGPLLGPDGFFHLLWVWRDSPDYSTNHTLSYARSKDLLQWESIRGEHISLPITIDDSCLQVDPTPIHGGLINIGLKIGFDQDKQVLAGYHKYDSLGNTQLYIARLKNKVWARKQITQWNYRWDFKGYGTIRNELLIESPRRSEKLDELVFGYHRLDIGDQQIVLNNATLQAIRTEAFEPLYPKHLDTLRSNEPDMKVNIKMDHEGSMGRQQYLLRWETFPANHDQKPANNRLKNTTLELIKY